MFLPLDSHLCCVLSGLTRTLSGPGSLLKSHPWRASLITVPKTAQWIILYPLLLFCFSL